MQTIQPTLATPESFNSLFSGRLNGAQNLYIASYLSYLDALANKALKLFIFPSDLPHLSADKLILNNSGIIGSLTAVDGGKLKWFDENFSMYGSAKNMTLNYRQEEREQSAMGMVKVIAADKETKTGIRMFSLENAAGRLIANLPLHAWFVRATK